MLRVVSRNGVADEKPKVNDDVVAVLEKLLSDAKDGKVAAVALVALDESWDVQPAFGGDAPASLMSEATRQLHELVARQAMQYSYDAGFRYVDESE